MHTPQFCGAFRQYNWIMWGSTTNVSKESTGPSSVSTSVGAILSDLARVYPSANECQILARV
jgi:hypothetical protein